MIIVGDVHCASELLHHTCIAEGSSGARETIDIDRKGSFSACKSTHDSTEGRTKDRGSTSDLDSLLRQRYRAGCNRGIEVVAATVGSGAG